MSELRPTIAERARSFAEICKTEGVDEAVATDMIRVMLARRGVTKEIAANNAARAVRTVYTDRKFDNREVGAKGRRLAIQGGERT
jgi:hypothetical protein